MPGRGLLLVPEWPARLPLAFRRMLQRATLAGGGVWLEPRGLGAGAGRGTEKPTLPVSGEGGQASPLASQSPALCWRTAGEPGRAFPAHREGALADLAAGPPLGWPNRGPGAGAYRRGAVLLVGERPHVARSGQLKHRLPFVSFDGAGCAPWLAEQLELAGVPETDLYWVNAYDALGVPTDPAFVRDLQPRKVVALGKQAAEWCRDAGLSFVEVPHPQFWKRFKSGEPYPLLDVLRAPQ